MILLQISAGRGPVECSRAVFGVCSELSKEAKRKNIEFTLVDFEEDLKRNTYKFAVVSLRGENLDEFVSSWSGSIKWIEQSPYRPSHKRKNWFVSVKAVPVLSEFDFDMSDIRVDTMRSSGAGGQHVNKTESAVRVVHVPSGISVVVSAERSQHRNRALAFSLLKQKIDELQDRESKRQERSNWQNHNELVRGNPVKVFRR